MSDTSRKRARARALRAAMVVTMGTTLAGGCAQAADAYCSVFERTRYCCEEVQGGRWDASARRCDWPHAIPVPGPFVPPAMA